MKRLWRAIAAAPVTPLSLVIALTWVMCVGTAFVLEAATIACGNGRCL